MFFIPMAIFVGHPQITVGMYIYKGIIPAGLGNIVGGGLFCGCFYYGMYLWREPDGLFGIPRGNKEDLEFAKEKGQNFEAGTGLRAIDGASPEKAKAEGSSTGVGTDSESDRERKAL
jgi:hypothetical protein